MTSQPTDPDRPSAGVEVSPDQLKFTTGRARCRHNDRDLGRSR
jgi:hypothetical protein